MTTEADTKGRKHWATILLGVIVAVIFVVAIFTFQVNETQRAVIVTNGVASEQAVEPGLHCRWFYPIQEVHKFDTRYRCFDGKVGKDEETLTKDLQNVVVGIYVIYRIDNPYKFYKTLVDIERAESQLNTWMRSKRGEVIGNFNFDQLINTDPKKMKLEDVEQQIKTKIAALAGPKGIEIKSVGIKSINIPESISKKVFDRMISERKLAAREFLSAGQTRAKEIRIEADGKVNNMLADAQAQAKEIRAEGDAKAAQFYTTFKQNPELAIFLRKLESLRKVMQSKTTLILDTDSAPFDIMKMNSDQLRSGSQKSKK